MTIDSHTRVTPEQLARALVDVAADRKAEDIVLLDLREVTIVTDYFVVCSGTSERQVNAVTQAILDRAEDLGARSRRIEGSSEGGWILLDFEDVIVHVFSPEQRDFYKLDELWKDAQPLMVIQ